MLIRSVLTVSVSLVLLVAPLTSVVAAQGRPRPVAEFAAGTLLFADNAIVSEGFGGGTVRFPVSPRLSVGPEVAFISGQRHRHIMLTGNLTADLLSPVGGRPRAVTPFVVAGAGLFQTTASFPGRADYSSSEGAFTAGAGVRVRAGDRLTLGGEARLGWEMHIRVNGSIGVRLGR